MITDNLDSTEVYRARSTDEKRGLKTRLPPILDREAASQMFQSNHIPVTTIRARLCLTKHAWNLGVHFVSSEQHSCTKYSAAQGSELHNCCSCASRGHRRLRCARGR